MGLKDRRGVPEGGEPERGKPGDQFRKELFDYASIIPYSFQYARGSINSNKMLTNMRKMLI